MTRSGKTNETASERYTDQRSEIAVLMDCIRMELDEHAKRAASDPGNWGFAGDLGHVNESLQEVLRGLLIGRHGWSETEAGAFIANHIEEMLKGVTGI